MTSDDLPPIPDLGYHDRYMSTRDASGWPRHRARARQAKTRRPGKQREPETTP